MNEIVQAIVLGVIQGLTEFLPVSSSGHLEIAKYFFGDDKVASESMLMTVVLHAATALSTIIVFWKDIVFLFKGMFKFQWNEETAFVFKIVLSMIPAALVGILFEDQIEQLFGGQIVLVAAMLIVTALLLLLADRAKKTDRKVSFLDSIIIGIAQAIAIIPGISRSGATISTSVLLGIDRERAARFSFLMVVPLILGKMIMDIKDGDLSSYSGGITPLAVGFLAAFITGLFACVLMIRLVKRSQLKIFSLYCFIVAAIVLFFFLASG